MGLDVSHDCWSGGYGSFNIFREALAKAAGIPLDMMQGYYAPDDHYRMYQPVSSMEIDELKRRPDLSWKVTDWDSLRYYDHTTHNRDGTPHTSHMVEYPDAFDGPVALDGVSIESMEWLRARGPDGPLCHSHYGPLVHDWVVKMARWLPLSWDIFKDDPLVVLLHHSDCDGDIRGAKVQRALADRLEELIPLLPEADRAGGGHLHRMGGPKGAAAQFAKGLREAASKRQVVRFY